MDTPAPPNATAPTLYGLWQQYVNSSAPVLTAVDLGTGSDFAAFIQHAGVPALHLQFSAATDAYEAVYHSNYDDYRWMSLFGDPGFAYHASLASFWGRVAMRLADDPVLPFDYVVRLLLISLSCV